ncbi:tyrosine-type recombinase/integrase [Falsiroseomonas sp. E2-1-a4]|uniref:tyrosine-type recombinase/integrase n=1 Tax=Falsiroseomonas sp. E2-1-a4 TaxID=3239299 RepID=UPI003F2E174C
MPKRAAGLTAAGVKASKPGIHVDGAGLMLVVKPAGTATWMLRYTFAGRRRDMGLGPARGPDAVSLAAARDKAADIRRLIAAGADPLDHRAVEATARAAAAEAARKALTFSQTAERYLAAHEAGWKNTKHRAQWTMTLREYAGPHLGMLPVATVETSHVVAALRPLWLQKPETASRLRGRIEAVLDFATAHGWREGANPGRWRGHLDKLFPSRSKVRPVRHHAALPWEDLPAFMVALRARDGTAARALELCVLTASRSGEVLGAKWSELDLQGAVWTVPATRMKAGREHRVALSLAAIELLSDLWATRSAEERDPLVFPGQRAGRPLSEMAMAMLLRRMGQGAFTPHGFRSTFRDWCGETTSHAREVVEAALAHRLGDRVEQAYARGDLFAKRRKLMEDWAKYCRPEEKPDASPPAPLSSAAASSPAAAGISGVLTKVNEARLVT